MSKIRVVFAVAGLVLLSTAPALLAQGVVSRDIDYVSGARYEDGKDLLDVFMPEGANGVPVVVFFHGGALRGGDKGSGRAVAERLVPEGIGVVSASYRLSPTFRHPAHVEDAASATAWVLKNIARYGRGSEASLHLRSFSWGLPRRPLGTRRLLSSGAWAELRSDPRHDTDQSVPLRRGDGARPAQGRLGRRSFRLVRRVSHSAHHIGEGSDVVDLRRRRRRVASAPER